jgi:hypothetical protein
MLHCLYSFLRLQRLFRSVQVETDPQVGDLPQVEVEGEKIDEPILISQVIREGCTGSSVSMG